MLPQTTGSFRLFRLFGIDVYLHWMWFLLLLYRLYMIKENPGFYGYSHMVWGVWEFIAIFGIVLLHEFGHALACKSVGGVAERIILWPLGGVAFVQPPPRPGPVLWSIAAGPLVNVVLVPILFVLALVTGSFADTSTLSDWQLLIFMIFAINLVLLIFNILPIYPLDGGQILQAMLWFVVGQVRSLRIAAAIGVAGGVAIAGIGLYIGDWLLVIMAGFIAMQAYRGIAYARQLEEYQGWR